MYIYIDESGTFSYPIPPRHTYACAGALTIPESTHEKIIEEYQCFTNRLGVQNREVKGRDLNEDQIAEVIRLLIQNDAKYHACAVDMFPHTAEVLASRKETQATMLLANITEEHQPSLVKKLSEKGDKIRQMSDQLFLQLCVMIELVNVHLQDAFKYYALKAPSELGAFRWVADRKAHEKTVYEELWLTLLPAFIHGRQFSKYTCGRIDFIEGGNYDYCKRYFTRIDKWPDYLPLDEPELKNAKNIEMVDINPILRESFVLEDSKNVPGLQLADILTNALRRAMIGNLQPPGWSDLGRLMFRRGNTSVRLGFFGRNSDKSLILEDKYAANVIKTIAAKAGTTC